MDRVAARRLLDVPVDADRRTIEAAFRTRARAVHPDVGGDAARFDRLVRARATLLAPGSSARSTPPVVVVRDPSPWRPLLRLIRQWRRREPARPRRVV